MKLKNTEITKEDSFNPSVTIIFYRLLFLVLVTTGTGRAQEKGLDNFPPPQTPIKIVAVKATGTINIDGKLDESDWGKAERVSDFFMVEPVQGGEIKNSTEVRVMYDDKNLYFGVFSADSLGKKGIRTQNLQRDFVDIFNDVFGIQIDAQNTKQYAVSFQTTPYGNQADSQSFNDDFVDTGWNALWTVRTTRTDQGYYAEFAIPFKSIRYGRPLDGTPVEWGVTFFRLARRKFEKSVFPAIPQSFSQNRMTYAAKLTGLEVPPPSANIRIEPYAVYQYDENVAEDKLLQNTNDPKVGGDVKWAIDPNTVLDLTINTDFAQADVDRAVNNLERFNIFFPERRQFFLENSGIWAGGGNFQVRPFFSRTIGLENSFNAKLAPLDFGTRFTRRNENNTLAGLFVRQRETDNSTGSNFVVARYLKNYGKENNIGAMVTYRLNDASSDLGVKRTGNTTISVDGLIRPKSELTFSYLLSTSLDSETGDTGYTGRIFGGLSTNKYAFEYTNAFVSRDYAPDMGFVFQNNVMWHNLRTVAILRPKIFPFLRQWTPGVISNYFHDVENFGRFQQANLYLFPIHAWFRDNSFIEAAITPTWQNINFDFAPLGIRIAQANYRYARYGLRYESDVSKKISGFVRYNFGRFYNGTNNSINVGLRYAPIPHLAFNANYQHDNLNGLGIDKENLDTDLYSAGLRLALNPRVQLSSFYQYNSFDKQGRWNVRFSWEYMPLSFIYLVFNDSRIDSFDPAQQNTQFISKITFLKQF